MNILLTGATGFIGSHLVNRLVKEEYEVTCVVRKTSNIEDLKKLDVKIFMADLRDKESLTNLPNNIDIVYHLAAYGIFSATSEKIYQEMVETNVHATTNLFLSIIEKNPKLKKFIHFSSLAAVGFQRGTVINNNTEPLPDTLYGESKYQGECEIKKLAQSYKTPLVIIRPSLVYGKNDFTSDFLKSVRLIKKGIFPTFGNGKNLMSPVIFVDDLIEICIRFMKSEKVGTFICANDEKFTINYFVETISEKLSKKRGSIKIPVWFGSISIYPIEILFKLINKTAPLNSRRIKDLSVDRLFKDIHKDLDEAINYHPTTNLKEGVDIVVDWYKENKLI